MPYEGKRDGDLNYVSESYGGQQPIVYHLRLSKKYTSYIKNK